MKLYPLTSITRKPFPDILSVHKLNEFQRLLNEPLYLSVLRILQPVRPGNYLTTPTLIVLGLLKCASLPTRLPRCSYAYSIVLRQVLFEWPIPASQTKFFVSNNHGPAYPNNHSTLWEKSRDSQDFRASARSRSGETINNSFWRPSVTQLYPIWVPWGRDDFYSVWENHFTHKSQNFIGCDTKTVQPN